MKKAEQYLPPGFDSLSAPERINYFRNAADKVEEQRNVVRELSEDQRLDLQEDLTQESLRLRALEEEKKAILDDYKSRIKSVKSAINSTLQSLGTGFETVVDDVYWIYDQEEVKAFGFTSNGQCVDERRLRPEERQTRIKTMNIKSAH